MHTWDYVKKAFLSTRVVVYTYVYVHGYLSCILTKHCLLHTSKQNNTEEILFEYVAIRVRVVFNLYAHDMHRNVLHHIS